MGKRKVLSEADLTELVLPEQGELLCRVVKLSGGDLLQVYQWPNPALQN